ncbi:E3 ubiquitin-protein ligase MARCH9-like isoform X2 [Phalaenopsis equestris]|uniref:E3 ubiquitin-protein ligase MARCH9-like isoform X2 n=1 Tax=Phalaenopsis equestris TaxID=78828 RepID=UPI0009E28B96|nr:E3 ubiquitin-protein ligase MARCH9-like isoform X2 [Phalaenopsis equestris]
MGQEEPSGNGEGEGLESNIDRKPNPNQVLMTSHSEEAVDAKGDEREKSASVEEEKVGVVDAAYKGFLLRSESDREECRVCQQQTEEPLVELGCGCRGELSKAHKSCIMKWFHTRGSNKCEICQKLAVNVPFPDSQSNANYCVWRVESAHGATNVGQRCITPLWVAFTVLIGGLLLDVLLSILLGVSALPVNIIIGVLIVLGLGTAFRLALECCHEWGARRHVQRMDAGVPAGSHAAV